MDERLSNVLFLVGAGLLTSVACGLGAVPVWALRDRLKKRQSVLQGTAIGLMVVAAAWGLIRPAWQTGGMWQAGAGTLIGVAFVLVTRWLMHGRDIQVGDLRGKGVRRSLLVFAVLFVHSLPEGMAMGSAQASGTQNLNLFILLAIALQNVPEGTAVAIPMAEAGFSRAAQFWAALVTSIPQPIGAPLAYLLVHQVEPLLPLSLAFAGGAMIAVSITELVPEAFGSKHWKGGLAGAVGGGSLMFLLSLAFGV